MRTPTEHRYLKALTTLLMKRKPLPVGAEPKEAQPHTFWMLAAITGAVVFVSWYTGWFAGCSKTPIAASIVPLLFGLLTAFLLTNLSWHRAIAAPLIVFAFMVGYDFGENVGNPMTVEDVLEIENIDVSDLVFDELTLLDATLFKAELSRNRHDSILLQIGGRIAKEEGVPIEVQAERIKRLRTEIGSLDGN